MYLKIEKLQEKRLNALNFIKGATQETRKKLTLYGLIDTYIANASFRWLRRSRTSLISLWQVIPMSWRSLALIPLMTLTSSKPLPKNKLVYCPSWKLCKRSLIHLFMLFDNFSYLAKKISKINYLNKKVGNFLAFSHHSEPNQHRMNSGHKRGHDGKEKNWREWAYYRLLLTPRRQLSLLFH